MAANISTVRALVNIAKTSENTPEKPVMIPSLARTLVTKYNTKMEIGGIIAARVVLSTLATVEIFESLYSAQPASIPWLIGFWVVVSASHVAPSRRWRYTLNL